jgi:hypothetical protein
MRLRENSCGSWPNRDPIAENGGANLYGFVRNDPVRRFDVLGQTDGAVGWPYPDPKPGNPPPSYPPPMPVSPKLFRKYDCSCCDSKEIDAGLEELTRRFGLGMAYLDKNVKDKDVGGEKRCSCGTSNERMVSFIEPTPRCWVCVMGRRWDKDPNNPEHGGLFRLPPPNWDENFIDCFTANKNGIQKEVIFDYYEHRGYGIGNGIYDPTTFYQHHPWTGTGDLGPQKIAADYTNCNEPDKQWTPNYSTFNLIVSDGRQVE